MLVRDYVLVSECDGERERGAFCAAKPPIVFCVPAVLLARSDTRVYLARRHLAGNAKLNQYFAATAQNVPRTLSHAARAFGRMRRK